MKESFVSRQNALRDEARDYIARMIGEKGAITLDENDENELVVPCEYHFTGEIFNLKVKKIEAYAIIGEDLDGCVGEVRVSIFDWCDGTAEWVADKVADYYHDWE